MNTFKAVWIVAIVVPVVAVILLVVTVVACLNMKRNSKKRRKQRSFVDSNKNELEGDSSHNNSSESESENVRYLGGNMFNYQFLPVADYRRKLYEHRMNTVHEGADGMEVSEEARANEKNRSPNKLRDREYDSRAAQSEFEKEQIEYQNHLQQRDLERELDEEIASHTATRRKSKFGSLVSSILFGRSYVSDADKDPVGHDNASISTPTSKLVPNSTSTPNEVLPHTDTSTPPRISFHINQTSSSLLPSDILFDNNSENNSLYSFSHSTRSYKKLQRFSGSNQSASAASLNSNNTSAISVGSVPSRNKTLSKISNGSNVNRTPKLQSPLFKDESVRPIRRRRSSLTHRSCNTPSTRSVNGTSPGSSIKQAAIITANRLVLDKPLPDRPDGTVPRTPPQIHTPGKSQKSQKHHLSPSSAAASDDLKPSPPLKIGKNVVRANSPHTSLNSLSSSSPLKVTKKIRTSMTQIPSSSSPSSTSAVTAKTSQSPDSSTKVNVSDDLPLPPPPAIGSCMTYDQPAEEEGVVAVVEQICRVTTAFKPKLYDELTLHRGDKVVVFKLFDDGWCTAQYLDDYLKGNKRHGVCPQGCLTPI